MLKHVHRNNNENVDICDITNAKQMQIYDFNYSICKIIEKNRYVSFIYIFCESMCHITSYVGHYVSVNKLVTEILK